MLVPFLQPSNPCAPASHILTNTHTHTHTHTHTLTLTPHTYTDTHIHTHTQDYDVRTKAALLLKKFPVNACQDPHLLQLLTGGLHSVYVCECVCR